MAKTDTTATEAAESEGVSAHLDAAGNDIANAAEQVVEAAEAVPGAASQAAKELEEWFVTHVHDSVISRTTDLFNLAHEAKESLKRLLAHLDNKE